MRYSWIIKLNFLILGFFLVIMSISAFKQGKLNPYIAQIYSWMLVPSQSPKPQDRQINTAPSQEKVVINLCQGKRVRALERTGHFKLFQKGYRWLSTNLDMQEINFLTLEKWLGKYCTITVQLLNPLYAPQFSASHFPQFKIQFIGDKDIQIQETPQQNLFLFEGRPIRSAQLQKAINELEQILKTN
ncbi:MAG: hypothetical protein D6797_01630 [Bdellovibrio sp.]|nr:MAG: hypothetical protein D6797_01630 [Bdellovibrio sp.]